MRLTLIIICVILIVVTVWGLLSLNKKPEESKLQNEFEPFDED